MLTRSRSGLESLGLAVLAVVVALLALVVSATSRLPVDVALFAALTAALVALPVAGLAMRAPSIEQAVARSIGGGGVAGALLLGGALSLLGPPAFFVGAAIGVAPGMLVGLVCAPVIEAVAAARLGRSLDAETTVLERAGTWLALVSGLALVFLVRTPQVWVPLLGVAGGVALLVAAVERDRALLGWLRRVRRGEEAGFSITPVGESGPPAGLAPAWSGEGECDGVLAQDEALGGEVADGAGPYRQGVRRVPIALAGLTACRGEAARRRRVTVGGVVMFLAMMLTLSWLKLAAPSTPPRGYGHCSCVHRSFRSAPTVSYVPIVVPRSAILPAY